MKSNTAIITTQEIIDRIKSINFVSHDKDDGSWQFLNIDDENSIKDAKIISWEQLVEICNEVKQFENLELGQTATCVDGVWIVN